MAREKKVTRKKVVLFIVEGITEKESLELLLSELISDSNQIIFEVIGGDITSNKYKEDKTIVDKITDIIQDGGKRKFKASDYREIIHLVDTDGVFISSKNIYKDGKLNKFVYKDNGIYANNIESVLERNKRKRSVLNLLVSTNKVFGSVPYRVFYFSCNLEHVLHDKRQMENRYKTKSAESFQDKYIDNLDEFVEFICESDFSVKKPYKESWDFIKENNNSIKRYTNFNLLFEDYVDI